MGSFCAGAVGVAGLGRFRQVVARSGTRAHEACPPSPKVHDGKPIGLAASVIMAPETRGGESFFGIGHGRTFSDMGAD